MAPPPIQYGGAAVDLSPRLFKSKTVAGSPALAAETVIASFTITDEVAIMEAMVLFGWAAFTVGASGTAVTLKLRQTDTSGTTVASTGAVTYTAGNLGSLDIHGFDTSPLSAAGVYVLTMTVAAGGAVSTVSAVSLVGLAI